MAEQATGTPETQAPNRAGQYLTLSLAGEQYGLEILKVREIIGMQELTAVPRTPGYVKGVMNLRGKVIPVIDLRLKFALDETQCTRLTTIVVVQVGGTDVGLIVDHVEEVQSIAADQIEDAPGMDMGIDGEFLLGLAKTGGKVTILLDVEKAIETEGLCAAVAQAA